MDGTSTTASIESRGRKRTANPIPIKQNNTDKSYKAGRKNSVG